MLLHALKGLNADRERTGDKPEKRRFVGKKLRDHFPHGDVRV